MNILTDETNLLRTHYYILKQPKSQNCIPLKFKEKTVYLHKECRGFAKYKFTHVNFISLFRVLGFSYMNFECTNLEEILKKAKLYIQAPTVERKIVKTNLSGRNLLTDKGLVVKDQYISYREHEDTLNLNDVIDRNAWPFDFPNVKVVEGCDVTFDYKSKNVDFYHFVIYINRIFNSNIATTLQNPIRIVYEEINSKYNMYRLLNNLQFLGLNLLPSVYDYFTSQSIIDYIENVV